MWFSLAVVLLSAGSSGYLQIIYFVSVPKGSFVPRSQYFSMKAEPSVAQLSDNLDIKKEEEKLNDHMTACTVFQTSSTRALKLHEASWDLLYKQYHAKNNSYCSIWQGL